MKKILLIFAVVIMHHAFASAQEGLTSPYLDSVIMAKMETGHVAGVSACIIKNGLVRWIGNYGFANIELGVPVDTTTLFYMASVSKTVTGTALMQLWEEGMFDLDDDINAYLPFEVHNPNYLTIPITFRMLCTHTSCIKDNEAVNPFYWGEDSPIPLGQFLYDYLNPAGVNYFPDLNFYNQQPGTAYNYSNVATALAGYLVEVIGDSTFAFQTKERIFNPLQMNESAWFLSEVDTSNLAMPYYWDGSALVPYGFYALSTYPAGALRTSVNQLATFLLSYMKGGTYPGGQILQSSTVDTIMSSQIPLIDPNQGLFWHKSYVGGRGLWGHDGINLGARTSMRFYPEENTGVIVLINTAYSDCNQIVDLLFDYASDSISCSCLPEGITFSTQAQIDNFQTNYPGCTEIEGDVTINGTDITNLNGLNVLTSIGGYLDIHFNNALTSLSGLDNLSSIAGYLSIYGNDALISLNGLENLTSIGGDLTIGRFSYPSVGNLELTSLTGLENLTSVGGYLGIINNYALTSLSGLDNLTSIGDYLFISGNIALTSLSGLDNLTSIVEDLIISGNIALTSLSGLDNLTLIGGHLGIGENFSLISLSGLENLNSVGGGVGIGANYALLSLSALDNLTSIGGYLDISGNGALTSLSGLDNIEAASITDLTITNNSSLSDCVAQSICDYLAAPNGTITISNNAPGCNSPEEVIAACEGQGIGDKPAEDTRNWNVNIFPNPGSGIITVEFEMQEVAYVTVAIFNLTGQQVAEPVYELKTPGQQQVQFDVSGLPPGVYYCRLQAGDRNTTTKIMISE